MARTKAFDEEEVLDKALQIFWNRGYNGTSMQDLIEGLGISRSSLYDTYSDKRELFLAALRRYQAGQSRSMIERLDNAESPMLAIQQLLKSLAGNCAGKGEGKGCFMVNATVENAAQDEEVAAIVRENRGSVEDALCRAIRRGQGEGEITERHSAKALARFLFNTTSGLQVASKSGAEKKLYEDVVSIALAALKP